MSKLSDIICDKCNSSLSQHKFLLNGEVECPSITLIEEISKIAEEAEAQRTIDFALEKMTGKKDE